MSSSALSAVVVREDVGVGTAGGSEVAPKGGLRVAGLGGLPRMLAQLLRGRAGARRRSGRHFSPTTSARQARRVDTPREGRRAAPTHPSTVCRPENGIEGSRCARRRAPAAAVAAATTARGGGPTQGVVGLRRRSSRRDRSPRAKSATCSAREAATRRSRAAAPTAARAAAPTPTLRRACAAPSPTAANGAHAAPPARGEGERRWDKRLHGRRVWWATRVRTRTRTHGSARQREASRGAFRPPRGATRRMRHSDSDGSWIQRRRRRRLSSRVPGWEREGDDRRREMAP